jgi:membrane protein implicated in regulation of membrane protease activity
MAIAFWAVLIIVSLLAELHTHAFVALFVGLAAAAAGVCAIAGTSFVIQAAIFVVASVVMLLALRPFAISKFPQYHPISMTAPITSTMANQRALVTKAIVGESNPGTVIIRSESWNALTEDPDPLLEDTFVIVTKVLGTTLWVTRDYR